MKDKAYYRNRMLLCAVVLVVALWVMFHGG